MLAGVQRMFGAALDAIMKDFSRVLRERSLRGLLSYCHRSFGVSFEKRPTAMGGDLVPSSVYCRMGRSVEDQIATLSVRAGY